MAFGGLWESELVGKLAKGMREEGPVQLCTTTITGLFSLSIVHPIRSQAVKWQSIF